MVLWGLAPPGKRGTNNGILHLSATQYGTPDFLGTAGRQGGEEREAKHQVKEISGAEVNPCVQCV